MLDKQTSANNSNCSGQTVASSPSSILRFSEAFQECRPQKRRTRSLLQQSCSTILIDLDDEAHHNKSTIHKDPDSRLKQVAFDLPANVYHPPQPLDEDECSVSSRWYSPDELQFMQERDGFWFDSVMSGTCTWDENKYTLRGLEYHDPSLSSFAVMAVLQEQDSQRRQGRQRPDLIANIYILSSHSAKKEGRRMGQLDAVEAYSR